MIDWVSFSLPYQGPPVGLQYLRVGRVLDPVSQSWREVTEPAFNRAMDLEGSYRAPLKVQAMGGRLYVSGNPVKWLTGQNVVGTNDLAKLIEQTLNEVGRRLDLWHCPLMWGSFANGDVNLTRVDCTFSYSVGSDADVATWLGAMAEACHVRFRGRGLYSSEMCALTFGMKAGEATGLTASRRSIFKFYNKWREMALHPPKCDASLAADLREQVWGTVRGEACYRGIELKRLNRDKLHQWNSETAYALHKEWISNMQIASTAELMSPVENELPRALLGTYALWKSGREVKELLAKNTFYRHRRFLLEHGIDIAVPCKVAKDRLTVVPVLKVLEAKPIAEDADEALFWKLAA